MQQQSNINIHKGNGRKYRPFFIFGSMDKNLMDYPLGVLSFMVATWLGHVTGSDLQAISTIFAQLTIALATAYKLYSDVKKRNEKP